MNILVFVILCLQPYRVYGARILGCFTIPSYSHQIVFQPIWRELALQGHEVVVITTDPIKEKIPNLKEIDISSAYEIWKQIDFITPNILNTPEATTTALFDINKIIIEEVLLHPEVQGLVKNETEHFDLYITEWLVPVTYSLAARFKCPIIGITSLGIFTTGYRNIGNPTHPVVYPDFMIHSYGELTFWERLRSVYFTIWHEYYLQTDYYPFADMVAKKFIGDNLIPVEKVANSVCLLVVNTNILFGKPRPHMPNIIEFSGMHIQPVKPLPNDIQTFLDKSTEGAVYLSFGTNVQSKLLPIQTKEMIIKALSELPYQILWKYEDDNLPNKPDNVKIAKWIPQQDVLRHPNVKLFITQGGLQSLEETIRSRVPVVGVPFFADQHKNMKRMVELEIAVSLNRLTMTTKDFKDAILHVIQNNTYKSNMEKFANLLEDQPFNHLDNVVWWIGYVIRHKGAKHLRSPYNDIPWFKYLLLDVIAFVLVSVFIFIFAIYKCLKYIFSESKQGKKNKIA